jgi:anti-sigma B factor antagonist
MSLEPSSHIRIDCDLDTGSSWTEAAWRAALDAVEDDEVRLDLSTVGFIDSWGLRGLIAAHNELSSCGRELVIVDPSPAVLRLLQLASLDDMLRIEPREERSHPHGEPSAQEPGSDGHDG